jgi:hypothetical protein
VSECLLRQRERPSGAPADSFDFHQRPSTNPNRAWQKKWEVQILPTE